MLSKSAPPRGLCHYHDAAARVVSGALLMLCLTAYLLWQHIWLFKGWGNVFSGLGAWFGLDVAVALSFDNGLVVTTELVGVPPAIRQTALWLVVAAIGLAAASWAVPARRVPARYSLRALALIVGLPALGFYALNLEPGLNVEAHVANVFRIGFWLVALLPLIFGLTAFTLPGNLGRRALVTLGAMLYFYFAVPVLALLHWQLLLLLGEAVSPALNVLLTVLLLSIQLIAFYGVAASVEK